MRNRNGSVLIEGVLVVFILFLSMMLNLELYRRVNYEVLLAHAAFIRARDKVMGVGETKSRHKICNLFTQALDRVGETLCRSMTLKAEVGSMALEDISERIERGKVIKTYSNEKRIYGVVGSVHVRYPQFVRFMIKDSNRGAEQIKSHLEITKKCPYPTASY